MIIIVFALTILSILIMYELMMVRMGLPELTWFHRQPKEKRKNDDKHKNMVYTPRYSNITYNDLLNAHAAEQQRLFYRQQKELVDLEQKQHQELVEWTECHARSDFIIQSNDDVLRIRQ